MKRRLVISTMSSQKRCCRLRVHRHVPGRYTGCLYRGIDLRRGSRAAGSALPDADGGQAVTGGIIESLQGGRFGHGFMTAGLTAALMPMATGVRNDVGRAAVGALIGGSISKVTAGKFANGALSGAIQGALMPVSEGLQSRNGYVTCRPSG